MTPGRCGGCGANEFEHVYDVSDVPVHSCLLLDDPDKASNFPVGDIELDLCLSCGLIQNRLFDPLAVDYSAAYEDSQAHSARFISFATDLIDRLDSKYDLSGKRAVEIGCGKGDFLVLLSNRLGMTGLGIDPAYRPGPLRPDHPDRLTFNTEPFTNGYDLGDPDLIVCRHTLEHLPDVAELVSTLRTAIEHRSDTIVFFEVPDSGRILAEKAFWDIYYEHVSYFTEGSLRNLFQACGFEVLETWFGMDDQYLMLTALPSGDPEPPHQSVVRELRGATSGFQDDVSSVVERLRSQLDSFSERGRTVLWGASSKAVSYLHALDAKDEVAVVVDINPVKWGKYLAGSGTPIVAPDALVDITPGTVLAMNSIYQHEIKADLDARGIATRVSTL